MTEVHHPIESIPPRPSSTETISRKVMIVDDDVDFAETLKDLLLPKGYEVAVFHNAEMALGSGGDFQPQVALIDIRLGRDSGIDLIRRLREFDWTPLCVMVTAYGTLETAVGALQEGAYDYLRKPVDASELFATLGRCFEKLGLENEKLLVESDLRARNKDLGEINDRLRMIVESAKRLPACSDTQELAPVLLQEFSRIISARGGSLYLCTPDGLDLASSFGGPSVPERIPFPLKPRSAFAKAMKTNGPVLVDEIHKAEDIDPSGGKEYGDGSFLILPMLDEKGVILGLISLHKKTNSPFTSHDRELGMILASLSAEVLRELNATQALQYSEERFRTLVSNIPGTVYRCRLDPSWTMEFISDNIVDVCGYPASDFIMNASRTYESIIHPDDRDAVRSQVHEQAKNNEPFLLEYRVMHSDGAHRWVYEKGQPIFDRQGNILFLDGVIFDITEKKKLVEDRDRLFSLSIDMLAIGSFEGSLTQINPAWHRMGWTEEELTQRPWIDFIHPDDREQTLEAIQNLRDGNPLFSFENRFCCKNGDYRWISWNSVSIPEDNLIFSVARDITDLKREENLRLEMEIESQRAQKMESLGVLAGGIAHDFNNILSGIIGYTNLTLMDLEEESMAHKNLEEVIVAANRASDLVQQILAFSRQGDKKRRSISLDLVLKEVLKLLRASIPSTIEIRHRIGTDIGCVLAGPSEVHQVIMNLCTNACHAMENSGGTLEVSLERNWNPHQLHLVDNQVLEPGEYALLRIKDSGEGIPSDIRPRIFEPFFTTKEVGKGTGMGLSVVHGVINKIGGAIACESSPDTGTQFDVYFPLTKKEDLESVAQEDPLLPGIGKILFVDDETMIVKMGVRILERNGYEVVGMSDSGDAFERFQQSPDEFDLVVTDYTMPKMTGDVLATKILQVRPDIPIILTTGLAQENAAEQAQDIGIQEVVLKPFRPSQFSRIVHHVLQEARDNSSSD